MIHFNIPPYTGKELEYVKQAVDAHKICGDGQFTKKCNSWLEKRFNCQKVLLTTSGSSALDMAALLCDLKPGDEGIALTRLALIGNAEFNGHIIEVRSSGDFIEEKSKIRVERIRDGIVMVEKV